MGFTYKLQNSFHLWGSFQYQPFLQKRNLQINLGQLPLQLFFDRTVQVQEFFYSSFYHIKLIFATHTYSAMRGKFERFKINRATNYEDGKNKVYEVLSTIECLHQMRIVQKIARPIEYEQKEHLYHTFKQKFLHLHSLLENIRKEMPKPNQMRSGKPKENFISVGLMQKIKRDQVRKIETAYREVFLEGSFRYFYMISKLQGLPLDLQPINIEQWVGGCLEQQHKEKCC